MEGGWHLAPGKHQRFENNQVEQTIICLAVETGLPFSNFDHVAGLHQS